MRDCLVSKKILLTDLLMWDHADVSKKIFISPPIRLRDKFGSMPKILTFDEAVSDARKRCDEISVLLGNGFSIDYDPGVFSYDSLADEAILAGLSIDKAALFESLKTSNFESIIDKLRAAASLQRIYGGDEDLAKLLDADARVIRNGLADALAARHPENAQTLTDDQIIHARTFLSHFQNIFTLSYDLLLYWVMNRETPGIYVRRSDGFEWPSMKDKSRVIWKQKPSRRQRVFFLHGALHFFVETKRLTKLHFGYGTSLIEGLRQRLDAGNYPLVVTEGTRIEKEARIDRSAYLRTGLRRFGEIEGALFIHGVSMSPNDEHILEAIEAKASLVQVIYVGIHGGSGSSGSKQLIARSNELKAARKSLGGKQLRVKFYDAASASVWR